MTGEGAGEDFPEGFDCELSNMILAVDPDYDPVAARPVSDPWDHQRLVHWLTHREDVGALFLFWEGGWWRVRLTRPGEPAIRQQARSPELAVGMAARDYCADVLAVRRMYGGGGAE